MGTTYLLDTNTVIYILNGFLPEKSSDFIKKALNEQGGRVSVITKIELLGWPDGTAKQWNEASSFIQDSEVLPLTEAIVDKTIQIKQQMKIKLPDAVIAATAIVYGFTLLSRNDEDFRKIPELQYLNPFNMA